MKGGAKVVIEAHRHEGVFIARAKEVCKQANFQMLCNMFMYSSNFLHA